MTVEQHDSFTRNLRSMLEHEACNFLESTIESEHDYWYLQLACRDAVRVELALLEVCEEELGWSGSIRIWGAQYDLYLELLDASASLSASVVRGSIQEEDDLIPPPVAELLREDQSELREEYAHDILIRVRLGQRQPNIAL